LSRLVEAGAVHDAYVVGQPGGWKVIVQADKGRTYTLTAHRKNEVRLFRKMDTLIGYLKGLGISRAAWPKRRHARTGDRRQALHRRLPHQAARETPRDFPTSARRAALAEPGAIGVMQSANAMSPG